MNNSHAMPAIAQWPGNGGTASKLVCVPEKNFHTNWGLFTHKVCWEFSILFICKQILYIFGYKKD